MIYKLKTIGVSNNLLTPFQSFLDKRYQGTDKGSMLQGFILGPLLFLIYIYIYKYLPNNLISNVKIFVDDTSIFSIVNNINVTTEEINNGLKRISEWTYQ